MKFKKKTKTKPNSISFPIWLIVIGLLCFCVIIVRVYYLAVSEVVDDVNIQKFASTRTTTTRTLPAERGTIYDINGNVLAQTVSSYTLIAYIKPHNANDPYVKDYEYTATELAKVINLDHDAILKYLQNAKDKGWYQTEFGTAGKGLTELQKDAIKDLNLEGIGFSATQKRFYPYGDFLSYTIGYATEETYTDENGNEVKTLVGKMGIEKQYDDILRGTDGYTFYQRDRNGYRIAGTKDRTVAAINGSDIYLSIDVKVQLFIEQAIENAKLNKYTWEWYTILVADAKTGAILGAASDPSFDPNKRNITVWEDYNVSVPFEPGSTMKIWSYMATMENSIYDGLATYKSGTYRTKDGTVIGDWDRKGWGNITYDRGFALSSNTGVINLLNANNIDRATLKSYYNKLGFGSKVGIELPNESTGKVNFVYETEYYNAGFGQGITTTPIQNIKALTSLANDGMLLQPYYVDRIVDSNKKVTYKAERKELYQVASKQTVDKMKDLMEDVISGNSKTCTGYPYYMEGYDLIIKTGSAQVANSSGYNTGEVIKGIAGMFPKDDPEIIIYLAAKKPDDGKGGRVKPMSIVVKDIVTNISSYYGIYDDIDNNVSALPKNTMGNYINNDTSKTIETIKSFGINPIVIGEGSKVINQYPNKGIVVTSKDLVIIVTNDQNGIKLPDFTGCSLNQVKTILSYLNIKYEIEGNGYVYQQSLPKDTPITDDLTLSLYLHEYYVEEKKEG